MNTSDRTPLKRPLNWAIFFSFPAHNYARDQIEAGRKLGFPCIYLHTCLWHDSFPLKIPSMHLLKKLAVPFYLCCTALLTKGEDLHYNGSLAFFSGSTSEDEGENDFIQNIGLYISLECRIWNSAKPVGVHCSVTKKYVVHFSSAVDHQ